MSVLVGRSAQLAALDATLHGLAFGQGRVLEISGEAGIGKTRLAQELARRADELGYTTLGARGAEFQSETPFGLIVDALDHLLATVDLRQRERLSAERLSELALMFPGVIDHKSTGGASLPPARSRLHGAVRVLLEELSARSPIVLVFDDVHWADTSSLELLGHLLRRHVRGPVLVALIHRSGRLSESLVRAIAATARAGRLTQVDLPPLTSDEAALLCMDFGPDDRVALHRESGGNPFYLEQLARSWRGGGKAKRARRASSLEDRDSEVPPIVRLALADELRALPASTAAVLRAGAVLGDAVDPELVAEVIGVPIEETLAAIDYLIARDLLRDTAEGKAVFRHPVVRRVVHESAGPVRRRTMHQQAALALTRRGAPSSAVAHHVENSALVGDEVAIIQLQRAAELDAPRAPLAAARWYRASFRLLPPDAGISRKVRLLEALASSLGSAGRAGEARAALDEALDLIPVDSDASHAQLVASVTRLHIMICGSRGRSDRLRGALAVVDDDRSACVLQLALAIDCWRSLDWEHMAIWASSALGLAQTLDDATLTIRAATSLAMTEVERGLIEQVERRVDQVSALLGGVSDADLAAGLEALVFLGMVEVRIERTRSAIEHLERGLRIVGATGQSSFLAALMTTCAIAQLYRGELDKASESLETAADTAPLVDDEELLMRTRLLECWELTLRGAATGALAAGEAAIVSAEVSRMAQSTRWARCRFGHGLVEAGDPARGRAEILTGAGGPELARFAPSVRSEWYATLTDAELALGRPEAAEEWVKRAEASVAPLSLKGARAYAHLARATVLLAHGDCAPASELALAAAAGFDAVEQRVDGARARTMAGRAAAADGHAKRAVSLLSQAADTLGAVGARRYRDDAARELRRLGVVPVDPGWPALRSVSLVAPESVDDTPVGTGSADSRFAAELFHLGLPELNG